MISMGVFNSQRIATRGISSLWSFEFDLSHIESYQTDALSQCFENCSECYVYLDKAKNLDSLSPTNMHILPQLICREKYSIFSLDIESFW